VFANHIEQESLILISIPKNTSQACANYYLQGYSF